MGSHDEKAVKLLEQFKAQLKPLNYLDVMRSIPRDYSSPAILGAKPLQSERLLREQYQLLNLIAAGATFCVCLDALSDATTRLEPGARSAVLVANERLSHMAGAYSVHLPSSFTEAARGLPISEMPIGTCGEAIRRGEAIACADVHGDRHWSPQWRSLCTSHGIKACYSQPILGRHGKAIASFFLCLAEAREANAWELAIAEMGANVAAVILERERVDAELRDSQRLQATLARISEDYAKAPTANSFLDGVVRQIAEALGASRAGLAIVDCNHERISLLHEFHDEALPSIRAIYDTSIYPPERLERTKASTTRCDDMLADEATAALYEKHFEKLHVRAYVSVPLKREGVWEGTFWVGHHEPYEWRQADLQLIEFVAERAWNFYELMKSKKAAEDAAEHLRRVTNNAQVGLTRLDRNHHYLSVNPAYARIIGHPKEDIVGRHARDVLGESGYATVLPHIAQALAGNTSSYEGQLTLPNGEAPYVHVAFAPDIDEAGIVSGWVASVADLSDRKQLDIERERHRQTFQQLIEVSPFGIYTVGRDLRFLQMNNAALTGAFRNVGNVIGESFVDAMHQIWEPSVARDVIAEFKRTLETGEAYHSRDFVAKRSDIGQVEGYEWELHRIQLPNGDPAVICYYFDATRLRETQLALELAEKDRASQLAELENLYRTSPIGLAVLDREGHFLRMNQALADMNGAPLEAQLGRSAWDFVPNLKAAVDPILERVINGAETVVAELSGDTPRHPGVTHWWKETWYPVRNSDGVPVAGGVIVEDITEQKRYDETRQLLVHELNHRAKNMLAMVQSIAMQSLRRARNTSEFRESFMGRLHSLARAHTLLTHTDWRTAEVANVVRSQLMVDSEQDHRIAIDGPHVVLEAQLALQLSLILHELATNARKHGALCVPDGQVSLRWVIRSNADHAKELAVSWTENTRGQHCHNPEATSGGFGMRLIRSLATGGATVNYSPEGVEWLLVLPLREAVAGPLVPDPPAAKPKATASAGSLLGRRVLVVEDEPLISMDLQAQLEAHGVLVVGPVGSLEEALALAETEHMDVALIDMNLHGQSVAPVAQRLSQRGIPFAYLTGYGSSRMGTQADAPVIPKPFDFHVIVETLQSVLRD